MPFCRRFLFALLLAFGFQAGIAMSAASAIKFGDPDRMCATIASASEGVVEALTPETPWPSCKSMTTAADTSYVPPAQEIGSRADLAPDQSGGLWRTLAIDPPPKIIPAS